MQTTAFTVSGGSSRVSHRIAVLLLACAAASSIFIWLQFAPRYFFQTGILNKHQRHVAWLFLHILTASSALFTGPFLLWSGFRKAPMAIHRKIGVVYLIGGGLGTSAGMLLSTVAKHRAPAFYLGTFFLGLVWLTAAFMGYRAIRNRQVEAHQEWMIRSYVLTWSFVACRIPDLSIVQSLGPGGDSTILWATWSVPLFFTEVVLQWRRSGARPARSSVFGGNS
ncbi:MAG: DUF2306 domain-containing protein [Bryobacteraceae bacterium]